MNNLLVTTDSYYKDKVINELKNKYKEYEFLTFNMNEKVMFDLLEEINTYFLFSANKFIVASNFFKNDYQQNEIDNFIKYLDNPNENIVLLITDEKADERKKLFKEINKKSNVYKSEYNIFDEIKNNLESYQMDFQTTNYLVEYLGNDINLIINELNKLKLFKKEDLTININDINNLVSRKLEDNVFELTNNIMEKNINKALVVYNDLINNKEEVTKLIIMIANQFILLKNVKELSKYQSEKDMATSLTIHPYRVKLANKYARGYSLQKLEDIILNLADIDYKIKAGKLLPDIAFELFLTTI